MVNFCHVSVGHVQFEATCSDPEKEPYWNRVSAWSGSDPALVSQLMGKQQGRPTVSTSPVWSFCLLALRFKQ